MRKRHYDVNGILGAMQVNWDVLTERANKDGNGLEKLLVRTYPTQRAASKFIYTELNASEQPSDIALALTTAFVNGITNLLAILPEEYRATAVRDIKKWVADDIDSVPDKLRHEEEAAESGEAIDSVNVVDGDKFVHTKQ